MINTITSETQIKIINLLKKRDYTRKELMNESGITRTALHWHLKQLSEKELVLIYEKHEGKPGRQPKYYKFVDNISEHDYNILKQQNKILFDKLKNKNKTIKDYYEYIQTLENKIEKYENKIRKYNKLGSIFTKINKKPIE